MRFQQFRRASSLRRALSALLMVLFFLVPTVDGAVCATDLGTNADRTVISISSIDNQQPDSGFDGMCVHGHAHEVAPMPKTLSAERADWTGHNLIVFRSGPLKSYDPGSLERPPRA